MMKRKQILFIFQTYYESPYDYYNDDHISEYQYLHQSHLNKNNNNSLSTESLTIVTPTLVTSAYTIQLSPTKPCLPIQRRCKRRLSSAASITTAANERTIDNVNENNH